MGDEPPAVVAGGVELLERAIAYTLGSLRLVTSASMSRPTPCAGWDLRSLLRHMNDSLLTLHEAADTGRLDPGPAQGPAPADPIEALKTHACQLLGRCAAARRPDVVSVGGHPLPSDVVAATGALEIAVHGWDVARACGHDRPLPASFAAELLDLSRLLVADADRPARFAAPVPVPDGLDPGRRLVGFLGRTP